MPYFFQLWRYLSFHWWLRLVKNLLIFLDNKLILSVNLVMWFKPMWQDTSLIGRILSFLVRTVKIISGITIIGLVMAAAILWWFIWIIISPILTLFWLINKRKILTPSVKKLFRQQSKIELIKHQLLQCKPTAKLLIRIEIANEAFLNLHFPLTPKDWLNLAQKQLPLPVRPEHLVLAVLEFNQWRYQLAKITVAWMEKMILWGKTPFLWDKDYFVRPIGGIDRGQISLPTPILDHYSIDLTRAAQKKQLPEIIGKETTIKQLVNILSREDKHHCLIIGEPGSGKTTLVKGLAQEIVRGTTILALRFKRLISLDIHRLAAGADEAEFTRRIEQIINEINAAKNIILFIDEAHNLPPMLMKVLEPALDEGCFQFIGATNTTNYQKIIATQSAFANQLEVVKLPEANKEETEALLEYLAWQKEQSGKIIITRLAISRIVELADRYFHYRVLPDKAVNLLDEVIAVALTKGIKVINSLAVDQLVTEKINIPVSQISQNEAKILLNLENKLHQKVIGQNTAVKAIAQAIRRARTQIKNPNKLIAGFLFAGPTGVGKTETAKALAAEFFGNEKLMIRLDMSEYQTTVSVDRLITTLSEAVRQQPYTLILLDEIEKSHKKIQNLFLQVLDDARLTDLEGKLVDFSNTIIIATTNAPNLKKTFAPEWLNRFSAIINFTSLSPRQIEQIIALKINQLKQNLNRQEIKIEFSQETIKLLAREAFSDEWGGRQADRIIRHRVENVIAEKILTGEIIKNKPYRFEL